MNDTKKRSFDLSPELYDTLVDWKRRLEREGPFYKDLFGQHNVRRVLDVACGTGHHAALFHSWGLEVVGVDVSEAMIDACRKKHGTPAGLEWSVGSFDDLSAYRGRFDAAVCVGNSLSIAAGEGALSDAVGGLLASLRAVGVCVLHVLNFDAIEPGPILWQKIKRFRSGDGERVVLKGVHRAGDDGYINWIELDPAQPNLAPQWRSSRVRPVSEEALRRAADERGGETSKIYGAYDQRPFDAATSQDLIVVCHPKPGHAGRAGGRDQIT